MRIRPRSYSRRVVALPRPEADSGPAGAGAGAVFAPGAPGAVLLHLVRVLPHAVALVAPLQREETNTRLLFRMYLFCSSQQKTK